MWKASLYNNTTVLDYDDNWNLLLYEEVFPRRLESLGIIPNESSVYDDFQQHIRYDGQRYEVNPSW